MNIHEELHKYQGDPRMKLIQRVTNQTGVWFGDEDRLMLMLYFDRKISFIALVDYFREEGKFSSSAYANPNGFPQPTNTDVFSTPWIQILRSYVPE